MPRRLAPYMTSPKKLRAAFGQLSQMMDEKNIGLIAAGIAFYAILALFPSMAALIALWGVVGDPGIAIAELEEVKALFPAEVFRLMNAQLSKLAQADGLTLGWASVVSVSLAIWSSRSGVAAMMRGLNAIYGAPNRKGVAHYVRALALTLSLIGVGLVALSCVVIAPVILNIFPLGGWTGIGLEVARWVIVMIVLLSAFSLIYRLAPNIDTNDVRFFSPGAVFAALCWAAASAGFSIYLANFGNYNEVYGSIGAVIAMLMWLYISAYLVLLGGALNAALVNIANRET